MSRRPRIAVLGLGGTISSIGSSALDTMDYLERGTKLSADEVVSRVPELARIAEPDVVSLRSVSSSAVTTADWMRLRRLLVDAHARGCAGAIVLHGTGTLEDTAYFLSLTLPVPLPVAIVGAQRPIGTVSSDAAMNLVAAARAVTDPGAEGAGVVMVLNDLVHAARDGLKTANYRLETFSSGDAGALARVDPDQVTWYRGPRTRHTMTSALSGIDDDAVFPRIDVVYSHPEADRMLIDAAIAAGSRGLVVVGAPPGVATPAQHEAMVDASAAGVPVVLGSRALHDRVPRRPALLDAGILPAGDLPPGKARVLLLCAAAAGRAGHAELLDLFGTH